MNKHDSSVEIRPEVEVRAAEDENRRLERERQGAERRQRWVAAIEQARIDHVDASRVKHLDRQLDDWIRYGQLRESSPPCARPSSTPSSRPTARPRRVARLDE